MLKMRTGTKVKLRHGALAVAAGLITIGLGFRPAGLRAQQKTSVQLPSRISPQAQKLIDRILQAMGGTAFLHYKSMFTTGRVFTFSDGRPAGNFPFKSTFEPPGKRRFSYGKSKPVILINTPTGAWELSRLGRLHQNPQQERNWKIANRYRLGNLLRYRIHESGVLILAGHVDFINNQLVHAIDIYDSHNVHIKLYVHRSSYLPLQITYRVQNPVSKDWEDYKDDYGDYQRFQGIATPMQVVRYRDGERIGQLFRATASYNKTIPPNYFQPVR